MEANRVTNPAQSNPEVTNSVPRGAGKMVLNSSIFTLAELLSLSASAQIP